MIPDMRANILNIERQIGPLPLALRVWYEQVGGINLYGFHPGWLKYIQYPTHLMNYCDPLQVYVLDDMLLSRLLEKHRERPMKHFEFAPDRNFKDNRSGTSTPYDIQWHDAGIDGTLPLNSSPKVTFVEYLRICFRWGGFPGMANWPEVPVEDLATLTRGLLPF